MPECTGELLKDAVAKKKLDRAIGFDGWRVAELIEVPVFFYDLMADYFRRVVYGASWAKVLARFCAVSNDSFAIATAAGLYLYLATALP